MKALVRERITLVDSDAPPAMPTLVPDPTATETAAAMVAALMSEASVALMTTSWPSVRTLETPSMLAVTSLSMRLCAIARPMPTDTLAALVVPEMLADAAVAIASMEDSSSAVMLTVSPDERLAAPSAAVSATVAAIVLSMVLKLNAPVALAAMADELPLTATLTERPNASDWIDAWLSAETNTEPSALTAESSAAARTVLLMSLMVSERPSPPETAVLWPTEIPNATAPATARMLDSSAALRVMAAPLSSAVVRALSLITKALVVTRIELIEAEPAPLPEMAFPEPEPVTLPAAPMASAKMSEALVASTLMSLSAVISELSTSARTLLPSPAPPIWLTEKAAPKAPAPPLPWLEMPTDAAMPPAPLRMVELSSARMLAPPGPRSTVLSRRIAWVSKSIRLTEPEAAPPAATPLPEVPFATLTAPARV
ncbi:MAG: hypothetical protein BWX88_03614 [Planctomycetes bacterium ADurb.Bin126]|nr:MAG: hypothetical protein BWX88_03614 [Planctomycetes bacterium ADurb.Bin126]